MPGLAQWIKLAYYPIAQIPRRDGVEVNLGAAFESGKGRNAELDENAPWLSDVDVGRLVVPLLIAGHLAAYCGVGGMDEVAHGADFFFRLPPGLTGRGLGVDLQGGIAVSEAGEEDGMVVSAMMRFRLAA